MTKLYATVVATVACSLLTLSSGCTPDDPLAEVRAQQARGDFAGSIEPLRALLDAQLDDAEADYLYGRALVVTGQVSLADWSLRKAMQDPDWVVPAGIQLAYGALHTSDLQLAIEATSQVLEAEPDNVVARSLRANAYAHSKVASEEALADVERVEELDPGNVEIMEPRFLALVQLERFDEAGEALDDLGKRIEASGEGPEGAGWLCATQAIFAFESDDVELAEQRWGECLEEFPDHANVVTNAVKFYDGRREFERSIGVLRAAYEVAPGNRQFRLGLTERLRASGRAAEAEELLRAALPAAGGPAAVEPWIDLAKHMQATGDFAAAAEATGHAYGLADQAGYVSPQLQLEHADALLLAGDQEGALAVADVMHLPAHREMLNARVAQQRGEYTEALAHFDEAFRLWPDNPWARYYAALAAEAIGDFDRAIESYRYAIRISSGATDARVRLARLELAAGRPTQALAQLRIQADKSSPGFEGEMLTLELYGWLGQLQLLHSNIEKIRGADPSFLGLAAANAARGFRGRGGPEAALAYLDKSAEEGWLDLGSPIHADALSLYVRYAGEADRLSIAAPIVRRALAAEPGNGAVIAIDGLRRELGGDLAGARDAYSRTLKLEPVPVLALAGLARLSLSDDPLAAAALYERAAEVDPSDPDLARGAAEALRKAGRSAEAEARFAKVLELHPYDAGAARQLAELRLARGDSSDATLESAERAVRFRGGPEALDLLARVHTQRGEPERAAEAADRAAAARARQSPNA